MGFKQPPPPPHKLYNQPLPYNINMPRVILVKPTRAYLLLCIRDQKSLCTRFNYFIIVSDSQTSSITSACGTNKLNS